MVVVKIKDKKVDGIINLDFIKVIYINYQEYSRKYELKAKDGKDESVILCFTYGKEKLQNILQEIVEKIENNEKLIFIEVNKDNILLEEAENFEIKLLKDIEEPRIIEGDENHE